MTRQGQRFRHYEKLDGERTYWNIRVTQGIKEKAKEIADKMGVSPSMIARNGIESELVRLEALLKDNDEEDEF